AFKLEGMEGVGLLSAGTDGTDGPTDAAGAFVDGETLARVCKKRLNAERYLRENDSYNFFKVEGGLFITGPTLTNVMDVLIGIVL
ncbi:MAG: glycerate kinase, partial [Deltaproteobacteria bacterium]|nr:glycerate kinase [Deltaproteobacteria bacterium]